MGNCNSGRRDGKPTVESTCAIPLRVHALVRRSRDYPDGLLRAWGDVCGNPFDIALQVTLDSAGKGTLRVQHAAFQHLTVPVPPQNYAIALEALPCRFGGVPMVRPMPHDGRPRSRAVPAKRCHALREPRCVWTRI